MEHYTLNYLTESYRSDRFISISASLAIISYKTKYRCKTMSDVIKLANTNQHWLLNIEMRTPLQDAKRNCRMHPILFLKSVIFFPLSAAAAVWLKI